MLIKRIQIDKFRNLNGIGFNLGRYTTAIAGHNATGKSTILALLGHCAELRGHKPIVKNKFRCEWNEIIKASPDHDERSPNIGSITFVDFDKCDNTDTTIETINYRTTWQKHKGNLRFRLLPVRNIIGKRSSSKKVEWPTLYLGLSRLYPLGESSEVSIDKKDLSKWNEELKSAYYSIFHINKLDMQRFDTINISETSRKTAIGLATAQYDAFCNSAGQDNLGQIILAILSFQSLKAEMGDAWKGGMLLIDELDATLHPDSLVKLYDYICKKAREIGIQVVFTTHSLYLIEHMLKKTAGNNKKQFNGHEIIFLSNANGPVSLIPSASYNTIYHDLTVTMQGADHWRKITVYAEDDEARWFLCKLIPEYTNRINYPSVKLGYNQLLQLLEHDFDHFRTHIILLDGDVKDSAITDLKNKLKLENICSLIKLPGNVSPEELLFKYYLSLDPEHELLSNMDLMDRGITKRKVQEAIAPTYTEDEKRREIYKEQFNKFTYLMEKVYPYWQEDNLTLVESFKNHFKIAFNQTAKYNNIPRID
jgi:energy-coupling factor transporter ATP-binding protein EcfA2